MVWTPLWNRCSEHTFVKRFIFRRKILIEDGVCLKNEIDTDLFTDIIRYGRYTELPTLDPQNIQLSSYYTPKG